MDKFTIFTNSNFEFTYSETFIEAHLTGLPANILGWNNFKVELPYLVVKGLLEVILKASKYSPWNTQKLKKLHEYTNNLLLKRFFRKNKVNAVLAEYGPNGVALMNACGMAGIPLIVHFHGRDAYDYKLIEEYQRDYQRMFKLAAALIAVSHDMEKQLLSLGASSEKIHYLPCGVNCSLFNGADPKANPPAFIAVGRFVDKKCPQLTLLAFKNVMEVVPAAQLIMVGDGILWEACKQLARALKIAENVSFTGPLPSSEVAKLMRKSRALVQHSVRASHGDSEGTPVTILEAGASGLPVVSTRHAGIKDVVMHGETGYLVEEGDVEGMSKYMIALAQDPNLAFSLGQNAREHICSKYRHEQNIEQLWHIIQSSILRK